MTYATLSDLQARAGAEEIRQVADRDRDGLPDTAVVEAALVHADNTIDGYIRARYALPLTTGHDLVRTWAVSIARHFLHRNGPPEHVIADYRDALAALKDVSAGRMALPGIDGDQPAATVGTVMDAHPPAVFTASKLRGW